MGANYLDRHGDWNEPADLHFTYDQIRDSKEWCLSVLWSCSGRHITQSDMKEADAIMDQFGVDYECDEMKRTDGPFWMRCKPKLAYEYWGDHQEAK